MDVTKDIAALRQKLQGSSAATTIRVQCLCQPEAELIQRALTPAERQRVSFSWLMRHASRAALQAPQLRAYVQN
jgi:hypothetical protein